jgi:shikimate kinase
MERGDQPVIIILGPKHAGKTRAGKALARLWEEGGGATGGAENGGTAPDGGAAAEGREAPPAAVFIDLDELVEKREGKSPRLLYRESPETFRGAEAEALRALLAGNPLGQGAAEDPKEEDAGNPAAAAAAEGPAVNRITIAAAGGGLADNREALEILKKSPRALAAYIEVSAETAWERIRAEADRTGELPPFLETENPRETHRRLHERRARVYRELAEIAVAAGNTPEETAAEILRCLKAHDRRHQQNP